MTQDQLERVVGDLAAKLHWLMDFQKVQIAQPTGMVDPKTNQPVAHVVFQGSVLELYERQLAEKLNAAQQSPLVQP